MQQFDRYTCRAKDQNGNWRFGVYIPPTSRLAAGSPIDEPARIFTVKENDLWVVDPETVNQCTGQPDSQKRMIFDGDILQASGDEESPYTVFWDGATAAFLIESNKGRYYPLCDEDTGDMEVVGNVLDNPDLLEMEGECL